MGTRRKKRKSNYDDRHRFDEAYGTCVHCGVSQRLAVGTTAVMPVRCTDQTPVTLAADGRPADRDDAILTPAPK